MSVIKTVLFMVAVLIFASYSLNASAADNTGQLQITSSENALRVVNGGTVKLTVLVSNTGTDKIDGIKPVPELPYKWMAESIAPETLNLDPGKSGTFMFTFSVPASQASSTQEVKISCGNGIAVSNQLTVPAAVSTNLKYLWIVCIGIVIAAVGTVLYFKKNGRR